MEKVVAKPAIGDWVSMVQIDRKERVNREQKALWNLLKGGVCSSVSHSGHGKKYSYHVLTSVLPAFVSIVYASYFPSFIGYSWAPTILCNNFPRIGKLTLIMFEGFAMLGYGGLHFFFVREGVQKLWLAIENLCASSRCGAVKKIVQESCIVLWSLLAASGTTFGLIYAQSDLGSQGQPALLSFLLASSTAMGAILRETAKTRISLANVKRNIVSSRKEDRRGLHPNDNVFRVVRSLNVAHNFWISQSSEFRESIYSSFILRDLSKIKSQAEFLYTIVHKANPARDMAVPNSCLRRIGVAAVFLMDICCLAGGLVFSLSLFQILALASPFLGFDEARRQVSTLFELRDNDVGTGMLILVMSTVLINAGSTGLFWVQDAAKLFWGVQSSLLCRGNPGYRNNEIFALAPHIFVARTFLSLSLALGAGVLSEGLNLMLVPVSFANDPLWIFVRVASAWCAMANVFTFSCHWIDTSLRVLFRYKGSPAQKALLAGVDVLRNLKTVLMDPCKNLDRDALNELCDCWYDAREDAEWLPEEYRASVNDSASVVLLPNLPPDDTILHPFRAQVHEIAFSDN